MPTNPFQTTVALIQQHHAPDNFTVTESAQRTDTSGVSREIDVVVEGEVSGVPVCIAYEVTRQGTKPDLPWAEGLIAKHEKLPTSQLVLVSWNGVTSGARKAIEAKPNVLLWEPELLEDDEGRPQLAGTLHLATVAAKLTKVVVLTERAPGNIDRCRLEGIDFPLFDTSESEVGTIDDLVAAALDSGVTGRKLIENLVRHEDPENVTHAVLALPSDGESFMMYDGDVSEFHPLHGIEMHFEVTQFGTTPVPIERALLNGTPFGRAEVDVPGHPLTLTLVALETDDGKAIGMGRFLPATK